MKRPKLKWGLAALLLASLAGAQSPKPQADDRTLYLYIWSEYIDDAIVEDFEKKFGVNVVIDLYESNEDMLAKLLGGGVSQYDLVVPSDYAIPAMIQQKLLAPLEHHKLPNFKNLDPKFVNPPFDPGNRYSIPYQWGTQGLAYRADLVQDLPRSWGVLFDPELQQGPFVLNDTMRDTMGSAAIYLGYSVNTTDPDELRDIERLLRATTPRAHSFVGGVGGKNQLLAGVATVAMVYAGDALKAAEENENIRYFVPDEGGIVWVDNIAITAGARHKDLAHAFINYLLEADVGARLSEYNWYASPNRASLPLIDPELREDESVFPSPELMKKLQFQEDIGKQRRLWDTVWTNIKN
ncbi:spermidine/putrescine transport system substrate-binding protein [Deinobacterium chartae]|uniref:Spermidine/putrescine transport system substrate-binding protein n=1 Tax=Deinobacterium chartae TaxID=521158 RepID=A0A841HY35_9DEIO|nr:spermidine/putrescine ABC transporter substrate-binding protein [Deinobacterium chartae]MBB6097120.1 spermidine/putrescine transport system substrate-binding protein [Deinobacterium chartae]